MNDLFHTSPEPVKTLFAVWNKAVGALLEEAIRVAKGDEVNQARRLELMAAVEVARVRLEQSVAPPELKSPSSG